MSQTKRTTSQSLEDYAFMKLRDMMHKGQLKPGEQLLQVELAEQLGISRTPLRRALANLQHARLVQISPRGEAFVTQFNAREIAEIFEVRAVLEGLSCRLVANGIEAKHTAYLRSLLNSSFKESENAYRQADIEFHSYIAKLGNNPFLQDLLDAYQIMNLSFAQGLLRPPQETLNEHMSILDALDQRNADLAEQEMRKHIRITINVMRHKHVEHS